MLKLPHYRRVQPIIPYIGGQRPLLLGAEHREKVRQRVKFHAAHFITFAAIALSIKIPSVFEKLQSLASAIF
jgi:hypothetical protein